MMMRMGDWWSVISDIIITCLCGNYCMVIEKAQVYNKPVEFAFILEKERS